MAKKYTSAEWNALQASLPVKDRMTYAEYIGLLENFKAVEAASGEPVTVIVDEQTKAAAMKTDTAAQAATKATAAQQAAAQAAVAALTSGKTLTDAENKLIGVSVTPTKATPASTLTAQQIADNEYATKIVANGLTQAQIDALEGQKVAAAAKAEAEAAKKAAAEAVAKAAATAAANAKLKKNEPLTPEQLALLNLGPDGKPIITTAGPKVVLTTAGPKVVLTTAGPGVVTTAGPNVVTTSGPNVVTTAGPSVVTTAGPLLTTAAPSGFTYRATDGTPFTDQAAYVQYQKMLNDTSMAKKATDAASAAERQSAYDLLYAEFSKYGLGSLVEPLRGLIQSGASPAEFTIKLRESDAYKKRFSANPQRISKGLKAISEAEYIGLEDQYQNILRNAGLPESYWKRGDLGVQEGFTNFIANDVSAVELEDRVSTAQQRLIYANPEVSIALKTFYPDISNGDLLAYALDPTKGLEQIKRRITAAEIGSSAVQLGLTSNVTDAEYLARYGVNKAQAQQGYRTAAEILPTASKLGEIYSKQGLGAYTQQTAEQEIFNVPGAAEAAAKRRKLSELEQASFSGRAGMGALARDRAGAF